MPKVINWEPIKQAYFAGDMPLTAVAALFGVSERAIKGRASSEQWRSTRALLYPARKPPQKPVEQVKKAPRSIEKDVAARKPHASCKVRFPENLIATLAEQEMKNIIDFLGLPPIVNVAREFNILGARRLDFLVFHPDGQLSIVEVKCNEKVPYDAIGQLLYYAEVVSSLYGISTENINLILLSSHDADDLFLKILEQMDNPIRFLKVSASLRLGK